jgi:uncharacterized protein YecT (DUF1311 family)
MKFLLALLLLAMTAGPVFGQSQSEMNREAAASFVKADAELNRIYAKVLATLDDEGRAKLKAAQRAWVTFRDAQAEFEMDNEARGGSMAPLIYEGFRARITKARVAQFKELLGEKK